MAHRDNNEIVVDWNPETRHSVVLVDGRLAARTRPAAAGGRFSKGIAAENLDLVWLEGVIRDLLGGALDLRKAMIGDSLEGDAVGSEASTVKPRSVPRPDQGRELEIGARMRRLPRRSHPQLVSLVCPLCDEAMILSLPARSGDGLICPPCARVQRASAALLMTVITGEMRQALDAANRDQLTDVRAVLSDGVEQLEYVERVLSDLGPEE
jgi:hypothetical protein